MRSAKCEMKNLEVLFNSEHFAYILSVYVLSTSISMFSSKVNRIFC